MSRDATKAAGTSPSDQTDLPSTIPAPSLLLSGKPYWFSSSRVLLETADPGTPRKSREMACTGNLHRQCMLSFGAEHETRVQWCDQSYGQPSDTAQEASSKVRQRIRPVAYYYTCCMRWRTMLDGPVQIGSARHSVAGVRSNKLSHRDAPYRSLL